MRNIKFSGLIKFFSVAAALVLTVSTVSADNIQQKEKTSGQVCDNVCADQKAACFSDDDGNFIRKNRKHPSALGADTDEIGFIKSFCKPLPNKCSKECEPSESMAIPAFMMINDKIPDDDIQSVNVKTSSGSHQTADGPDKQKNEKKEYDFSLPVPESEKVDDKYFENALFIGDSRTVGLMNRSGVKSYYYCRVGLSIRGVFTNAFIEDKLVDGEPVMRTIMDTIEKYPIFKKVYICFGLNELGWDENAFINTYGYVIDRIRALLPDADIYIQSVIPVTKEASDKNRNNVNMDAINNYNRRLAGLAEEKKVYFLAIDEYFKNEDGYLVEPTGDGIHLGGKNIKKQFEYFRTHVVKKAEN